MEKTMESRGNGAAKVVEVVETRRVIGLNLQRGGSACAINFAELLLLTFPLSVSRSFSLGPVREKLLYWTVKSRR